MVTLKARMTNYGLPRYRWLTHAWNYFQREVSAAVPGGRKYRISGRLSKQAFKALVLIIYLNGNLKPA
jgi:hypothetical protein